MTKRSGSVKIGTLLGVTTGILFVVVGALIIALVNYNMRQQALAEAEAKMRLILDRNLAIHTYFSQILKPNLFEWTEPFRSSDYFDPSWMSSSYAVREMGKYFMTFSPAHYYYKDAVINARNMENEADAEERTFIAELKTNPSLKERSSVRSIDGKPYLVVLRPGEVLEASCLRCHGNPDDAPGDLVRQYGPERSFRREAELGTTISAVSVRVPLAVAYAQVDRVSRQLAALLLALLGLLFAVQFWLPRRLVFAPLAAIRDQALQVSTDENRLGEQIPVPFGQELSALATAFNGMSTTLRRDRDRLEARVEARTADLATANEQLERDITERKRMEAALQKSQSLLRATGQIARVGGWELDVATHAQTWTEEVYKIHEVGLDFQPTVSNGIDFYAPEAKPIITQAVQRAIDEGEPFDLELPLITARGNRLWIHAIGHAQRSDGKTTRLLGTFQDITERKQAQDALRESEKRFRVLFEQIAVGVSLLETKTGRYVDINQRYCDFLGYTMAEMLDSGFQAVTHPDDVQTNLANNALLIAGKIREFAIEKRYIRKDGTVVWGDLTVSPLWAAGEEPGTYFHIAVVQDITERKRAEEALRQTLADLQRSNAELEQFAYVASHDLQEPLRMVSSYVQLLAKRYRGRLDADADEFIDYAVDGAKRMQQLITDLLTYSRVGTHGDSFQPTDCNHAVQQALANLSLAIEDSGAVVTIEPLPTVPADQGQLVQLFQNLIGNAIKFRGIEPPRVHVSAQLQIADGRSQMAESAPKSESPNLKSQMPETAGHAVSNLKSAWLFSVRDNGVGIDPKDHARVFGIFQRLHTRAMYPGTGIGLAICQRIVERHGGRIWVESQPGKGATFYFTLPSPDL